MHNPFELYGQLFSETVYQSALSGQLISEIFYSLELSGLWIPGPLPLDCTTSLHTSSRSPEVPHSVPWRHEAPTSPRCVLHTTTTQQRTCEGLRPTLASLAWSLSSVLVRSARRCQRCCLCGIVRSFYLRLPTSSMNKTGSSRRGASLCRGRGDKYESESPV